MLFVSPLFLWALAAISVPIAIHLFNFRKYKKVYFTNVRFLKELQLESKSRSRLKELLVLLARCSAIASLVFAFSQPYFRELNTSGQKAGANAVSIYIDNSFSMQNVNKQGALFELAKTKAKEVVNAFSNADRFQLLTNDFEGKHQRFNTKEDVLTLIDDLKISSAVRNLSDVLKRQSEFLKASPLQNKKSFILSDAQETTFNLNEIEPDTLIRVNLIPLSPNLVNNVYVDTCWFETPLQQQGFIQTLHARIVNAGDHPIDAGSAKLILNKQQVALASFSLEAESKTNVVFTFECKQSGFNYGSVKLEDYPITFDDELFFAFNSRINVSVCLVNGKELKVNNSFSSLLGNDSLFNLQVFSEQVIDYGKFKTSNVLILNQLKELSSGLLSELQKFTNQGGAIVIIPALHTDIVSYNQAFSSLGLPAIVSQDSTATKVDKLELASGFYDGVFEKIEDRLNLPLVNNHFKFSTASNRDVETIMTLQNSDPFLVSTRLNNASLYMFASALNESSTNFSKHALFVPTLYKICFSSLKSSPLFYSTNSNVVINLKQEMVYSEQPPHIIKNEGNLDIIPEMRVVNNSFSLLTRQQISDPGFYTVNKLKERLAPLAFNYSRRESDLKCFTTSELEEMISSKNYTSVKLIADSDSNLSKQIELGTEGKKLWKLFILLALIFIGVEIALLRLLK